MYIVILDDEEPRQEAMLQVLGSLNVRDEIIIFDNAPDMIQSISRKSSYFRSIMI